MFKVTVQNVTGTRQHNFTADSLEAAKRRASETLRNGVIHYSVATITDRLDGTTHTGSVSVGGHRCVWHARREPGEAER
jgi:hypothetical protein